MYPTVEYTLGMRVKTSVTLPQEALKTIDEVARRTSSNRSRVIEAAVLDFVARRRRAERDARDLAFIDSVADELNREMEDVLDYQAPT